MTREEKQRVLSNLKFLEMSIKELSDRYEELLTAATHITAGFEERTSSGTNQESMVEKSTIKLTEINHRLNVAVSKKNRILNAIGELKPYYAFLLMEIDVKGKSIGRVSKEIKRKYQTVQKAHSKALDLLFIK